MKMIRLERTSSAIGSAYVDPIPSTFMQVMASPAAHNHGSLPLQPPSLENLEGTSNSNPLNLLSHFLLVNYIIFNLFDHSHIKHNLKEHMKTEICIKIAIKTVPNTHVFSYKDKSKEILIFSEATS